ncbi:MAG: type I restriction-modification enzyme R subunit C-terminal domain-containing protein, partial [Usitatibacteraceae bacterium]
PYEERVRPDPLAANTNEEDGVPAIIPRRIKVKLRDGKERTIQHMTATSFMSGDGTMMSAAQFLESLFGALPEFFKDEDELRAIWSVPETRREFLSRLADKGFGHDQMIEMQKIIEAEKSDLFDVLAFVAFALPPVTRGVRAAQAREQVHTRFNDKQEAFLQFVLAQYEKEGVHELDQEKLSPLLRLKYSAIGDAVADLGNVLRISEILVCGCRRCRHR